MTTLRATTTIAVINYDYGDTEDYYYDQGDYDYDDTGVDYSTEAVTTPRISQRQLRRAAAG